MVWGGDLGAQRVYCGESVGEEGGRKRKSRMDHSSNRNYRQLGGRQEDDPVKVRRTPSLELIGERDGVT